MSLEDPFFSCYISDLRRDSFNTFSCGMILFSLVFAVKLVKIALMITVLPCHPCLPVIPVFPSDDMATRRGSVFIYTLSLHHYDPSFGPFLPSIL